MQELQMEVTLRDNHTIAYTRVYRAVHNGHLPKLDGTIPCVDCEAPATKYDHRNYLKPLQVDPVCNSCNLKRGPGLNKISSPPTRPCLVCKKPLTGRADRRYCSDTCRVHAWAKRKFGRPVVGPRHARR